MGARAWESHVNIAADSAPNINPQKLAFNRGIGKKLQDLVRKLNI